MTGWTGVGRGGEGVYDVRTGRTGVGRVGEFPPDTGVGYTSSPVREVERKMLSNRVIAKGSRSLKAGCAGVVSMRTIRSGSLVYFWSSLTYPLSWHPAKKIRLH